MVFEELSWFGICRCIMKDDVIYVRFLMAKAVSWQILVISGVSEFPPVTEKIGKFSAFNQNKWSLHSSSFLCCQNNIYCLSSLLHGGVFRQLLLHLYLSSVSTHLTSVFQVIKVYSERAVSLPWLFMKQTSPEGCSQHFPETTFRGEMSWIFPSFSIVQRAKIDGRFRLEVNS